MNRQWESGGNELRTRIITALVLAPAVLLLVWAGGAWFVALVAVAVVIMAREWAGIAHAGDVRQWLLHSAAGIGGLLAALLAAAGMAAWPAAALSLAAWGGVLVLRAQTRRGFTVHHVLGPPYLALAAFSLAGLRLGQPEHCGLLAVVVLLAVIWSADTLAYFTGRALGGPKLAPRISPKKTWSGFFGAVAGGALAGGVFGWLAGLEAAPLVMLGALLGGVEQMGDLFESALKRRFGVKDSGTILPGHGGLLDRVDGLVAAAVLAMLWGMWSSGGITHAACGVLTWGSAA